MVILLAFVTIIIKGFPLLINNKPRPAPLAGDEGRASTVESGATRSAGSRKMAGTGAARTAAAPVRVELEV